MAKRNLNGEDLTAAFKKGADASRCNIDTSEKNEASKAQCFDPTHIQELMILKNRWTAEFVLSRSIPAEESGQHRKFGIELGILALTLTIF